MLILLATPVIVFCLKFLNSLSLSTVCLHLYFCFRCLSLDSGTGRGMSAVGQLEWAFSAKEGDEGAQASILPTSQSSMFFSLVLHDHVGS